MNIQLISLQVAGGVILFLFGLQMIFSHAANRSGGSEAGHDVAVFPLAVPSIVGPEAIMAVIMLTDNHTHTVPTQAMTAAVMRVVLAITCVFMLLADPILRVIGKNGAAILERVMGMGLAALAVELVMDALGIARWAVPAHEPAAYRTMREDAAEAAQAGEPRDDAPACRRPHRGPGAPRPTLGRGPHATPEARQTTMACSSRMRRTSSTVTGWPCTECPENGITSADSTPSMRAL